MDEPPLAPRPRKSLSSSESLLQGAPSPSIPAALPEKSVGNFPPHPDEISWGGAHNVPPSEGEGDRGQELGSCGETPQAGGNGAVLGPDPGGPGMEVPPLVL